MITLYIIQLISFLFIYLWICDCLVYIRRGEEQGIQGGPKGCAEGEGPVVGEFKAKRRA